MGFLPPDKLKLILRLVPRRGDAEGLDEPRPVVDLGGGAGEDDDLARAEALFEPGDEVGREVERGGGDVYGVLQRQALPFTEAGGEGGGLQARRGGGEAEGEGVRRVRLGGVHPGGQSVHCGNLGGGDALRIRLVAVHVDAEGAAGGVGGLHSHQLEQAGVQACVQPAAAVSDQGFEHAGAEGSFGVPGQQAGGEHAPAGDALGEPDGRPEPERQAGGRGDKGAHSGR